MMTVLGISRQGSSAAGSVAVKRSLVQPLAVRQSTTQALLAAIHCRNEPALDCSKVSRDSASTACTSSSGDAVGGSGSQSCSRSLLITEANLKQLVNCRKSFGSDKAFQHGLIEARQQT